MPTGYTLDLYDGKDVTFEEKEYVKEVNRVHERNKWLLLLRKSLKQ